MKTSVPQTATLSSRSGDNSPAPSPSNGFLHQTTCNPLQLLAEGIIKQSRFNPMQLLASRQSTVAAIYPSTQVIQKTAGTVNSVNTGWEVMSTYGNHGPYTIANLAEVQAHLQNGLAVDYENMKNGSVWIYRIGNQDFSKPQPPAKKQNLGSPINLHHTIPNNLGLPLTAETAPKDRPWLMGNNFNIDFGGGTDPVAVDGKTEHQQLHDGSLSSTAFRGNSVSISWTLYYDDAGKILSSPLSFNALTHARSADFKHYTDIDLNDMYALGRIISGGNKYNTKDSKQTAGGRYHSERDMILQAERLPDFGGTIAAAVTDELGGTGIPKLLMIHVHSHKLRICEDCYQFLEAFMGGGWITTAKAGIKGGDNMKISMLTSADEKHPILSERKFPDAYKENDTIDIDDLPDILNMDVLRHSPK